jgi:hypothetical protein
LADAADSLGDLPVAAGRFLLQLLQGYIEEDAER